MRWQGPMHNMTYHITVLPAHKTGQTGVHHTAHRRKTERTGMLDSIAAIFWVHGPMARAQQHHRLTNCLCRETGQIHLILFELSVHQYYYYYYYHHSVRIASLLSRRTETKANFNAMMVASSVKVSASSRVMLIGILLLWWKQLFCNPLAIVARLSLSFAVDAGGCVWEMAIYPMFNGSSIWRSDISMQ